MHRQNVPSTSQISRFPVIPRSKSPALRINEVHPKDPSTRIRSTFEHERDLMFLAKFLKKMPVVPISHVVQYLECNAI